MNTRSYINIHTYPYIYKLYTHIYIGLHILSYKNAHTHSHTQTHTHTCTYNSRCGTFWVLSAWMTLTAGVEVSLTTVNTSCTPLPETSIATTRDKYELLGITWNTTTPLTGTASK